MKVNQHTSPQAVQGGKLTRNRCCSSGLRGVRYDTSENVWSHQSRSGARQDAMLENQRHSQYHCQRPQSAVRSEAAWRRGQGRPMFHRGCLQTGNRMKGITIDLKSFARTPKLFGTCPRLYPRRHGPLYPVTGEYWQRNVACGSRVIAIYARTSCCKL